jgi:hypothetical protein
MKLQQLSVFMENKPGQLKKTCDALALAGINISTLMLADTKEFGILRLLIRDWERAKEILEKDGFAVRTTEVVALEVQDKPGGLAALLVPVESAGLNIEYMYAYASGPGGKAVLIFRFSDPDKALEAFKTAGVNILTAVDLFKK